MKQLNNLSILFILISFLNMKAAAQEKVFSISLAQASDNKFTQEEPAKFNASFPSDKNIKESFLVNGYLGMNFRITEGTILSLTGELQRNTLLNKEQSVQQYGLKAYQSFVLSGTQTDKQASLETDLSVKYSKDAIKDRQGAQLILATSLNFYKLSAQPALEYFKPNQILPTSDKGFANFLQYRHSHSLGIEYVGYEKLGMINGTFGLELYPFSGLLNKIFGKYNLLQLKGNITERIDFTSSKSTLYVGALKTLGAAINIKFDTSNAITFGYEYVQGGNPLKGLENQKYGQLAIGAKIDF